MIHLIDEGHKNSPTPPPTITGHLVIHSSDRKGIYDCFGKCVFLCGPLCALNFTFTFTFSHFADAFIQSDLQLGNT